MSEMVQNSDNANHTSARLHASSPLIPAPTPAWHTGQTPTPDRDAVAGSSARRRQSETSQQMSDSQLRTAHSDLQQRSVYSDSHHTSAYSDLRQRSENSQHAASRSDQTLETSWHTQKYSPSASVPSDLTSEHSRHSEISSTKSFVSSRFPATKQSTVMSGVGTQTAGGASSQTSVTNTESSLNEVRGEEFTRWSSYSTSSVTDSVFTASSQTTIRTVKSESLNEMFTSFSQSDLRTVKTKILGQLSTSVSHLVSSQSVPRATETTGITMDSVSLYKSEISASAHIGGSVSSQVTHGIQSSLYQIQMSQSGGEGIPSSTQTPPLPTTRSDYSGFGRSEESVSSISVGFLQSRSPSSSSPSVSDITSMDSNVTATFLSKTSQGSDITATSHVFATAIVTSPSSESVHTGFVSSSGVLVSSAVSQLHMMTFSISTAVYENSTILINAPAAGVSKPGSSVSQSSRSDRNMSLSDTGELSTPVLETSSHEVTTQSKILVSDSHKSEFIVSSLSSTKVNVSHRMSSQITETPSLYSQSIMQTVSVPIKANLTEKDLSTIFLTPSHEHVISPSSVYSELMSSSMLHQNITPTSVYQSENITLVSQTSQRGVLVTSTTEKASSVYNMTTTTPKILLEIRDVRFLFKFHGDCHLIQNNSLLFNEFLLGLVDLLSKTLTLQKSMIKLDKFNCRPLRIYTTLIKVSYHNVTNTLKNMLEKNLFIVKVNLQGQIATFEAVHMEEVPLLKDAPTVFDMPDEGLDKVDIIVIIVACCICGVLLSIGGILCIKECYKRKYAQSFDLMEVPHVNLKLEDFSLTRIPRAKAVYNDDSITMQSYTDSYGQHVAKGSGGQIKSNNGMHVRMNENTDGIVIGVVGTSRKNGHSNGKKSKWRSSVSSENSTVANPSMENLLPSSSDSHTTDGASNPVFVDDESPSSNDSVSKGN